ncbi:MAG: hypothetical protein COT15_01360 [Candidatus Diapherotrites archaeon CG08_land_8_20_14_0_20_34_12]|nr:MAG: hypothetical protein COT15_01360 [Candidatus Diapherotrites archaeon CG08_land_8_20_14_0_20_34_12]
MLREHWLTRIALGCAIFGLIILAFYYEKSECEWKTINGISKDSAGSKVSIFGRIREIKQYENSISFQVYDGNTINAVIFNPAKEDFIQIQDNDLLNICGSVSKYKGKLEIIVESFKVV